MTYGQTETVKQKTNKHKILFLNRYWETRDSWGHETELIIDGMNKAYNKVRYYNRTWECYRFQSCMLGCVQGCLESIYEREKYFYKQEHDIKRLTGNNLKEFEKYYNSLDMVQTLRKVLKKLK